MFLEGSRGLFGVSWRWSGGVGGGLGVWGRLLGVLGWSWERVGGLLGRLGVVSGVLEWCWERLGVGLGVLTWLLDVLG